jgi:hypothetical protein
MSASVTNLMNMVEPVDLITPAVVEVPVMFASLGFNMFGPSNTFTKSNPSSKESLVTTKWT